MITLAQMAASEQLPNDALSYSGEFQQTIIGRQSVKIFLTDIRMACSTFLSAIRLAGKLWRYRRYLDIAPKDADAWRVYGKKHNFATDPVPNGSWQGDE